MQRLLSNDRAVTALGLLVLAALAWTWLLAGAGSGMSAWDMTSLSAFPHLMSEPAMGGMAGMAGMETAPPKLSLAAAALLAAMWLAMMVAMMSPSAASTILLYDRVARHARRQGAAAELASSSAFAAGYLLVWLAFAVVAAAAHIGLEQAGLLSSMGSQNRWLSALVLLAAGAYQLSPLKRICLVRCRSPAVFLSRHWRPGAAGAVRLGVLHGGYCLGCCWVLMALLFVGGVMNVVWIAALTLLVLAEKLLPAPLWIGRATGGLLLAWAAATLAV